ncbi:ybl82 protein [Escherichia coli DEC5B]|nr:ybl82 protein [Escherichia coli DEC5B]
MHILFNSSRSCFLLLMASSVNTGLLIVTPISKQPSDVLTFGNNVSIIASSTMNFVMRCLVPPGDVNQLTINAGYSESPITLFWFNCSACAQPHSPHHKIHFKKGGRAVTE